jgi:F420H(2)-dependent quinone reductase
MATVQRKGPPLALVRVFNPVARTIARSPMHGLADKTTVLLHVTGRKTGRRYDIPIGYVEIDGRLVMITIARWRVNLRGGADVEVTWHGRRRPMRAMLEEDPAAVAVAYQSVIDHLGWPRAARQLGISTPGDRQPTLVELRDAAAEYGWSIVTLTAR